MVTNVMVFPAEKARKTPRQLRPKPGRHGRSWQPYKFSDLAGGRPIGHPKQVPRGPRGGVQLAVGQVWVDLCTDELWVIRQLELRMNRFQVHLSYYRSLAVIKSISSVQVKGMMRIWDDAAQYFRDIARKLVGEAKSLGIDPVKAARYFGIDPETGEIVDER